VTIVAQGVPRSADRSPRIYAALMALAGLAYALPGALLAAIGGSHYYVVTGVLAIATGVLLWRGQAAGVWTYVALLALTLVWALAEAGVDGWALMPRLLGPALFGLWMALPWFRRRVPGGSRPAWAAAALSVAAILLIAAGLMPARLPAPAPLGAIRPVAEVLTADPAAADWPNYGNDPGNARFSALTQINRDTVADLAPAWTFRLGRPNVKALLSGQVTPLKIGRGLYLCTGKNDIIRLDPETGHQMWRFEANNDMTGLYASTCRGVAYYRSPTLAAGAPCAERILTATTDGRLLAVDARDGAFCRGFGNNGQVDVKAGMGDIIPGYFNITSPPQIIAGKAVIGGQIADGQSVGEPSAVIRAYDAQTGAFAWVWDIGRPGVNTEPGPGEAYARGMPNSWAPMAADPKLGLVYVPTGNATPDYFGGHRTPAMDRYSSSIVALDAATGKVRWSFQTTHHDLWDYDVASPPTLLDVPTPGGIVPAVLQGTKRGELFLLDRRTGRPLAAVEERPVPVSTLPGERSSPTQLTRAEADARGVKPISRGDAGYVGGPVAQKGTPYAADIRPFLSPVGVPCTQPPFGMLSAIDMKTRKLLWSRPFGTGRDAGPLSIASGIPPGDGGSPI
jgi:quinoprotein glucose dehydrogenase